MRSVLILGVLVAILAIACVLIYRRRKRPAETPPEQLRPKAQEPPPKVSAESQPEEANPQELQEGSERRTRQAEEEQHHPESEPETVAHGPERPKLGTEESQPEEALPTAEPSPGVEREAQVERIEDEDNMHSQKPQDQPGEEGLGTEDESGETREELRAFDTGLESEEQPSKPSDGKRPSAEEKTKRVTPVNRGGRPRDWTADLEARRSREGRLRPPKPEIVCWERGRQWRPAVEVTDDLLENPGLSVHQNNLTLTEDVGREGYWPLKEVSGLVLVQFTEDEVVQQIYVSVGKETYLLFKLSGPDENWGRLVKSPSFGSYLVVAPENWERNEALSGSPPVAPEPVSLPGYRAHFFKLERNENSSIGFITPEGELEITSTASRFRLTGKSVRDASRQMGPLFGERPPAIRAQSSQDWETVGTIVIGVEGSVSRRWRKEFSPQPGCIDQDLPAEVAERKAGWFFVRFYDLNEGLTESLDFRFVGGLKDLRLPRPCPVPSETGHTNVSVELLHERGCCIHPQENLPGNVQILRAPERTAITIPPDPRFDQTRWSIGPEDGGQVQVVILVERVWWALAEENQPPREWKDARLTLSHHDFAATSNRAVWLRVPRPRWVDAVHVGFEQANSRPFPLEVTKNEIAIPLREFEVPNRTQEYLLRVWIQREDGLAEGIMAVVPPEHSVATKEKLPAAPAEQAKSEERVPLDLATLSATRLASLLTRLCRATYGPLRTLIEEVRREYFSNARSAKRRRPTALSRQASCEFVRNGLCVLALFVKLCGERQFARAGCKRRWALRARLAEKEFPELMCRMQNRHEELKTGRPRAPGRAIGGKQP